MICALALMVAIAPARASSGVIGVWKTPVDGGSTVRIDPCGEWVCGRVLSSPRIARFPYQKDVRNRDVALRGRPIAGLLILKLRSLGPNRWGDGWVYDPQDGGTYKGAVEVTGPGRMRLRGCIVAPLCQTQTWTRVQ